MKPVRELLLKYNVGVGWCDPFSGQSLFAGCRNDLAVSGIMALDFLKGLEKEYFDGVLFDPPYSPRQMSECYKSVGLKVNMQMTQGGWPKEKDEISRIVKLGGYCISFGWNSCGCGKKRGFEIEEILLVSHGGGHNDTICTVENKVRLG